MNTKSCQICGVVMQRKNRHDFSERDWSKKTTCSVKCRGEWVARIRRAKWVSKKCLNCKKDISRRESIRKFCSLRCQGDLYKGNKSPHWKGGRKKHGEYIQIFVGRDHPFSDTNGYMMEHRKIVELWLKEKDLESKYLIVVNNEKYLNPLVKIHHKNHNKSDNTIENLQPVFTQKEHFQMNYCPHCEHCKSGELLENPNNRIISNQA